MGYIRMAKKVKAKASGESEASNKKKKRPVKSFIQKMIEKMKQRKAKRKIEEERKRETSGRREPEARVDEPKDIAFDSRGNNLGNKLKELKKVQDGNENGLNETTGTPDEKTFLQKYGSFLLILAIVIILITIYFATKKKN